MPKIRRDATTKLKPLRVGVCVFTMDYVRLLGHSRMNSNALAIPATMWLGSLVALVPVVVP